METIVWILVATSFVIGLIAASTPKRSTILTNLVWLGGIAVVAALVLWLVPSEATFESFTIAIVGSLASFLTAFAVRGLIDDFRKSKSKSV